MLQSLLVSFHLHGGVFKLSTSFELSATTTPLCPLESQSHINQSLTNCSHIYQHEDPSLPNLSRTSTAYIHIWFPRLGGPLPSIRQQAGMPSLHGDSLLNPPQSHQGHLRRLPTGLRTQMKVSDWHTIMSVLVKQCEVATKHN